MKQTIFWNGLKNMQKECYLQPIYDVKKNKINVAEALIRVKDFEDSFYNTELLIADVEDKDCSSAIDLWMLEEVCKNMRRLEAAGVERVNVNLSPKSYMDESLETEIRRIMKQYDVQTKQIWFELTELTDVQDKESLKHLIEKLHGKGFRFALDDFGKGQSNLIRLFDYNFQCIKFDKELVWKMLESKMTVSMLRHIVEFAHENNICITAEGVETADLAKALIDIHCDYLQGYLISKPIPIDDFISFVNSFICRPYVKYQK